MQTEFDGIIIGSGHNGLVCANYMARAGLSILVLEATDVIGGGMRTPEGPIGGFYHNTHAVAMRWNAEYQIWKDIELSKYGAELIQPQVQYAQPGSDGSCIIMERDVNKTVESLKKISPKDAETFARKHKEVEDVIFNILMIDRFCAPIHPDEARDLLSQSDIGKQYLEFADASVLEIVEANFKDDRIQAMLGFISCLRGHGPVLEEKGNGIVFPLLIWAAQNGCLIKGGTKKLGDAMVRSLFSKGGLVLKNRPVEKIVIEGGRAVAVKSGAHTFRARKFIASNLVPQQTLLDLCGSEYLDASLVEKIRNYKPKIEALFGAHTAHREKTHFHVEKTEPRIGQALVVNIGYERLQDIRDDFAAIRTGVVPRPPKVTLVAPTWFDDTQAPPGGQSTLLWQFAPCQLADGGIEGWDKVADGYADDIIKSWARYGDNIDTDNLLMTFAHSSQDTVQTIPSMVLGDRHHGEYSVDQMQYFRPTEELSQYATPIEGLYLCGASTHPGGSITGAPGHNAASRISRDLGEEPWWNPPDIRTVLEELRDHGRTSRYARMGL